MVRDSRHLWDTQILGHWSADLNASIRSSLACGPGPSHCPSTHSPSAMRSRLPTTRLSKMAPQALGHAAVAPQVLAHEQEHLCKV